MKYRIILFLFYFLLQNAHSQEIKGKEQIDKFLQQYEFYLNKGDKKEASRFLNEAATAHWERKEYQQAIEYFKKSLKLNEELGNESGMSMLHNNMGMIYSDLREYETSLSQFQKTLEFRRKVKDKVGVQSALINSSVVLNNLKKYDKSIEYLKEALDIARQMNDAAYMRSCYGMLAETYEKAGDVTNTILYFNLYRSFHELVQKNNEKRVEKVLEDSRVQLLQLENDKQRQELELLKKQSLLSEKDKEIASLDKTNRELYETSTKKDLMLRLLEKEAKLKEQKIQEEHKTSQLQRNIFIILGVLGLVVILFFSVLSYLLFQNNKFKERTNALLIERNEEILAQHDEIQAQKEALNETNKLKDKLFSVLAHDLRSPFATIESLMMLYEFEEYDQAQTKEFLSQIRSLSNSTLQTLENTLDWVKSQIASGYKLQPVDFNLHETADEVIEFLAEIARTKKIAIVNNIDPEIRAHADMNQIRIIIRNLISNAIKFTREGGNVILSTSVKNGSISVSVTDTGVGIPADKIGKLFNTNTHFTTQGTKHEKGTGLGLLLCKELVEKNGGNISVKSKVNEGTTFQFTLNESATSQPIAA